MADDEQAADLGAEESPLAEPEALEGEDVQQSGQPVAEAEDEAAGGIEDSAEDGGVEPSPLEGLEQDGGDNPGATSEFEKSMALEVDPGAPDAELAAVANEEFQAEAPLDPAGEDAGAYQQAGEEAVAAEGEYAPAEEGGAAEGEYQPAEGEYQPAEGEQAEYAQHEYQPAEGEQGDAGAYAGYGEEGAYDQYGEQAYGEYQQGMADEYGAQAGAGGATDHHTGSRSVADALAEEREKHEAQLKVEAKAREELEDMILRIEKHFKAEQAARKKAEELLQNSIAAEMESKNRTEEVLRKRSQEQRLLEDERAAIKRERMALESMRQEFEGELQAARAEVAKAQEALAASEERIRATEQLERARLEADCQQRLGAMSAELDRMRQELGYRTAVMGQEMEKWRQQATATATAVLEAKNEVLERKKELDHTKEKMDRLLEKLYIGRERGIELSGAIASNQRMMSYMPGGVFLPNVGPKMGPGSLQPGATFGAKTATKLPPVKQAWGTQGHLMDNAGFGMDAGENSPELRRALSSVNLGTQHQGTKPRDISPPAYHATSRSDGQPSPDAIGTGGNAAYAHVQSKFARDAAEKSMAAKSRVTRSGRTGKGGKPDRFAEAERDAQRLAGMGRRWN